MIQPYFDAEPYDVERELELLPGDGAANGDKEGKGERGQERGRVVDELEQEIVDIEEAGVRNVDEVMGKAENEAA